MKPRQMTRRSPAGRFNDGGRKPTGPRPPVHNPHPSYKGNETGSPDDPGPCSIKPLCRACKYVNTPYEPNLNERYEAGLDVLGRAGVLGRARPLGVKGALHQLQYRCVAKLAVRPVKEAVRNRDGERPGLQQAFSRETDFPPEEPLAPAPPARFAIGLFQPESHRVVDIDNCPLHAHPIRRLVIALREKLEEATEITPYDEAAHAGDLRYVTIRAAHMTGELMIVFVARTDEKRQSFAKVVTALRAAGHRVLSAWININPEKTNAILGKQTEQIFGVEGLRESVCDLHFEIAPTAFFQVNPWQAEAMYRRIVSLAGPVEKSAPDKKGRPQPGGRSGIAWDLYSGVGQISLNLAREGYRVFAVEEIADAAANGRANAQRNNLTEMTHFQAGRAEDVLRDAPGWAGNPDVIVANPSRRGMDAGVLKVIAAKLVALKHCKLIYMSCDVSTMARDLKVLSEAGAKLRQVEAYDMFPQTGEMEWLAVVTA